MSDIVIVAEYCDTSSNSTGFLISELESHLSKEFSVRVLVPPPVSSRWGQFVPINSLFAKVYSAFQLLFLARKHASRDSHLLVTTNPFLNWFTCRFFGSYQTRSILVLDFFPEALGVLGDSFLNSALLGLRNLLLPKFDNYFALSSDMCQYLQRFVSDPSRQKVHKVPIWVKPRQTRLDGFDQDTALTGKPSSVYFGNLGILTDIDALKSIVEALSGVLDVDVIGAGSMAERLRDSLPGIRRFGLGVSFDRRIDTLSKYGCSIVIQPPVLRRFAVPSKAFFSWEFGRPVVLFADPASELFREVETRSELGIAVPYGLVTENQVAEITNFVSKLTYGKDPLSSNPCADYLMTCRRSSFDTFSSVFGT